MIFALMIRARVLYNHCMPPRNVVIVSPTALTETLVPMIEAAGFRAVVYQTRPGYIARLADDQPVMIVAGIEGDWGFWVTTPRVNPASHRIPLVAAAPDTESVREALAAGAAFAITPENAADHFPNILRKHARMLDEGTAGQLAADCTQALPPDAAEAIRTFNAGDYYHQHDLLEALWMREEGPARNLYQAILQVGIAYFQVTRNNRRGALKMILRAQQWLSILPDVCQGVDVAQLRADSMAVRAALEGMPGYDLTGFDRSLLRPVVLAAAGPREV